MSESKNISRPSYFRLGLFIIVAISLIGSGVVVLGASSFFERHVTAQTIVNESINGLDVGSPVKYRGVTIGKVSRIAFGGKEYGLNPTGTDPAAGAIVLELSLQPKAFPSMNIEEIAKFIQDMAEKGLRARLASAGLSGQSYLELNLLDPQAYPPPKIGVTPKGIYIPSAPSEMGQTLSAVERIATDLQKANLPQVIAHYDDLAKGATSAINGMNDVVQQNRPAINSAMHDLPDLTQRVRHVVDRADGLLNDEQLKKFIASLPKTTDNANSAIGDLHALLQQTQAVLAENKDDLHEILADLRKASADAAAITDDARQNPSRVLFGQPPAKLKEGQ